MWLKIVKILQTDPFSTC